MFQEIYDVTYFSAPYDDSQPTEDEHYKGHENSLMFLRRFVFKLKYIKVFNLKARHVN